MANGQDQSSIGTIVERVREPAMIHTSRRLMLGLAASALLAASAALSPASAAGQIRIAFGDVATVETLNFLIAVERAKERGVDIEVTYFKSEDIAAQAVVGGQADIGVGAPYTVLQKVKAPIRIFYQMSTLALLPGGQHRVLPGLEGPRRPGDRRPFARLRHRGHHAADGQAPGHRVQQHLLRAGLRGARDGPAAGPRQGHHRRIRPTGGSSRTRAATSSSCWRSRTSTPPTRRSTPTPSS